MKRIIYCVVFCLLFTGVTTYAQNHKNSTGDTTVTFSVAGVCGQCKHRIEEAAQLRGVQQAHWNIDTKMLTVTYDTNRLSLEKINHKIAAAGHDTYLEKADDADYDALPDCCHYREHSSMDDRNLSHEATATPPDSTTFAPTATIKGIVLEEDKKGTFNPLVGASVLWLGTATGTVTNENGVFSIPVAGERLVISYTGFAADTITAFPEQDLKIILAQGAGLNEVKVTSSRASTFIASTSPFRTTTITQKELLKAACCNLSESFETNPSVDVSYNDAVTGSKQIQLLGLAGIYAQLTVENLPGPRGIATSLGLNSIPGTWIESIQLSKGTGSVANGFESIAGQINVELKKPASSEQLYANVYVNNFGKTDLNLNLSKKLNAKWATSLLLHDAFFSNNKMDFNRDGFRDMPTGNLFSAVNRWSFDNGKGWMSQFGVKLLLDDKTGGQVNFDAATDKFTTNRYGLAIHTRRAEGFAKIGYVFPQKKYKSIGLQLSAFNHRQASYFGLTNYDARQQNFYSNLIYQSIINNTAHKFRTGLSFVYDRYNEQFKATPYQRTEITPGAFFEYTFTPSAKWDVVAGIRADHNSLYGWFATPRLNVRYEPFTGTVIRASVGKGLRTANIFAENNSVLVSARTVEIARSSARGAYGLQQEVAWNKGIAIDQKLRLFGRSANLGVDFFRNDFVNQVVVDLEDPRAIQFYNLQGKSYSNSLQVEGSFAPVQHLDVRLAYRMYDVKTNYGNRLLQRPLTAQNRALANLAYTVKGWKLDYTVSYNGKKRLPSTVANPAMYQRAAYSPSFVVMNAQVSKTLGKNKRLDVYAGGENLTNYFQQNAIIAASEPFGNYFDASLIWGPVTGSMWYAGIRFTIP